MSEPLCEETSKKTKRYDLEIQEDSKEASQELQDSDQDRLTICEDVKPTRVKRSNLKINVKTAKGKKVVFDKENIKARYNTDLNQPLPLLKKGTVAQRKSLPKSVLKMNKVLTKETTNATNVTNADTNAALNDAKSTAALISKAIDKLFESNLHYVPLTTEELHELYVKYKTDGHFRPTSNAQSSETIKSNDTSIGSHNLYSRSQNFNYNPHLSYNFVPNTMAVNAENVQQNLNDFKEFSDIAYPGISHLQNQMQYNINGTQDIPVPNCLYESNTPEMHQAKESVETTGGNAFYNYPHLNEQYYNFNIENNHLQPSIVPSHNLQTQTSTMAYKYPSNTNQMYKVTGMLPTVDSTFCNTRNDTSSNPINIDMMHYADKTAAKNSLNVLSNGTANIWNTPHWNYLYNDRYVGHPQMNAMYPRNSIYSNPWVRQYHFPEASCSTNNFPTQTNNSTNLSKQSSTLSSLSSNTDENSFDVHSTNEFDLVTGNRDMLADTTSLIENIQSVDVCNKSDQASASY